MSQCDALFSLTYIIRSRRQGRRTRRSSSRRRSTSSRHGCRCSSRSRCSSSSCSSSCSSSSCSSIMPCSRCSSSSSSSRCIMPLSYRSMSFGLGCHQFLPPILRMPHGIFKGRIKGSLFTLHLGETTTASGMCVQDQSRGDYRWQGHQYLRKELIPFHSKTVSPAAPATMWTWQHQQ